VASVNIKEGVTHTFFSLAGEGTGNDKILGLQAE
jgi:hypothetical protein